MSGVYLDASALAKVILIEADSAALRAFLSRHPIRFTNRVAQVEVARAVARLRAEAAPVDDAFEKVEVLELTESLAISAGSIGPGGLRSLDAIHLASALSLGSEVEAFVTYDLKQADAARAAGLHVVSPQ